MSDFIYLLGTILILLWAIGFLGFDLGGFIHVLLMLGLLILLYKFYQAKTKDKLL